MNEEALLYSFDLFSKDGYNGSQKEYIQLLGENIQALQHSYKLFQKDGYDGTIDNFSEIIGVKKKRSYAIRIGKWEFGFYFTK